MRNNEDRFGPPSDQDYSVAAPIAAQQQPSEASLNFVAPTEFVDLPSKGKLYPPGHPLHGKDTLEIKFMTAKEEDILTSKSLLKKGVAIDRMLQNLIVDKNVKLGSLLAGDKNALIVASRISGYGPSYDVNVACPSCEARQQYSFNLNTFTHKDISDVEDLRLEMTQRGTYLYTLPRSKMQVEFRLMTADDENEILQEATSQKGEENASTSSLKRVVVSVNGNMDRHVVNSFVDSMPVMDARLLRSAVNRISPDIEMNGEFVCASCGHEEEMEVPLTAEFFWPK